MLVKKIRLYENREDVTLTTYILDDSEEMLKGAKRPAVLVCPGGGYLGCSDREAEPVAIKFASMGYHAFVLRYSTYIEKRTETLDFMKPLTEKKHCLFPAQIRETAQAFLIIGKHAEEWHIDMDKIILCGFSAGAHNVSLYASLWNSEIITDYFKESAEKFRPAAMILGYTGSDYPYIKEKTYEHENLLKKMIYECSMVALAGIPNPDDEFLKLTSPITHIGEQTPPAFLWATSEDEMLNVQNSLRYAHVLADHQIPFELHVFEKCAHGMSLATQATAGKKAEINQDVAKWTEMAASWLEQRFALEFAE